MSSNSTENKSYLLYLSYLSYLSYLFLSSERTRTYLCQSRFQCSAVNGASLINLLIIFLSSSTWCADLSTDPAYGAYVLFPQGSVRVMAMGGAGATLNEDSTSLFFNPAGAALGEWKLDIGGTSNHVKNDELAYNFPSTYGTYETIYDAPYSYLFYSAGIRWGAWVLGLGVSSPFLMKYEYINPFSNKIIHTIEVSMTNFEASLARSFGDHITLGITHHSENLREYYWNLSLVTETASYTYPFETKAQNSYFSGGILLHTKDKRFRIGGYTLPGRKISVDRSGDDILEMFNTVVFRDVNVPSKTVIGFSAELFTHFIVAFDMDYVGSINNSIYVSSISTSYEYVNAQDFEVPHGGMEYALIHSSFIKLYLRAGGYQEPTRFRNGRGRDHWTYGAELQIGPGVFSYGVDVAPHFYNSSQGFSLTKNF